jgi:iron(III) transport system permease protein
VKCAARALPFAILVLLLGAPLLRLLLASFSLENGGWSLAGWREALALRALPRAALNTLAVGAASSVLATGAGGLAALLVARARPAGGPWVWRAALAAPMLIPQSVLAAAWAALADRRGGLLNVLAERAGLTPRLDVFGVTGLCLVSAACVLPPAFLILESAFSRQDPALEEIAEVCGATPAGVLRRVTLPLVVPALAAVALLSLLTGAVAFGPQAVIGYPAGLWTLPNLLYSRWNLYTAGPASTAALAVLLLALGGATAPLLARAGAFSALAGPRTRARPWPLSPTARVVSSSALGLFALVAAGLPLAALVLRSLAPYGLQVRASTGEAWRALDATAWRAVLSSADWRASFARSFGLAAAAAALVAGLGFWLAAFAARPGARGAAALDAAASWPLAWSGTALAVAVSAAFGGFPFGLQGTTAILLAAYLARELPLGYLAARAAVAGAPRGLEETALACGASPLAAARAALWPAARPALAAAAAAAFAASYREIEVSVLLAGVHTGTFGTATFTAWSQGDLREMSAAALLGAALAGASCAGILAAGRTRTEEP